MKAGTEQDDEGNLSLPDFRETAAQCFPSQAKDVNAFFDARLNVLWLKMQMQARRSNTTSSDKYYRALRPTKPCSGSCRKRRLCKPFMAMWRSWRERATNSLQPCCTYGALPPCPRRFVKSTRSVFGPAAGFDSKELQVGNGICVWILRLLYYRKQRINGEARIGQ